MATESGTPIDRLWAKPEADRFLKPDSQRGVFPRFFQFILPSVYLRIDFRIVERECFHIEKVLEELPQGKWQNQFSGSFRRAGKFPGISR